MKVVGMLGVLTLLAAGTAVAMPSGHWGPGWFGGGGTLLNQLIYPCQAKCESSESACTESAASSALTAVESACSSQITTAQTDCDTYSMSSECKGAVRALHTCAQSDLKLYYSAVSTCRDSFETCTDACE